MHFITDKSQLSKVNRYKTNLYFQAEDNVPSLNRHLLEFEANANGTFLNKTCMYFWFRGMTAIINKEGEEGKPFYMNNTGSFKDDGSTCTNKTAL